MKPAIVAVFALLLAATANLRVIAAAKPRGTTAREPTGRHGPLGEGATIDIELDGRGRCVGLGYSLGDVVRPPATCRRNGSG